MDNFWQSLKASDSISVTLSGIIMFDVETRPLKSPRVILVIEQGSFINLRCVQPSNELSPTSRTESGIMSSYIEEQFLKVQHL